MFLRVIAICTIVATVKCAVVSSGETKTVTTIKSRAAPFGSIELNIVPNPHHLFIGQRQPGDRVLHQENVILYNDGKSHVAAGIRMTVEAEVAITCVKIYDESKGGSGGYPKLVAGGIGHKFVEFTVTTEYGKGFHYYVQIFGHVNK